MGEKGRYTVKGPLVPFPVLDVREKSVSGIAGVAASPYFPAEDGSSAASGRCRQ